MDDFNSKSTTAKIAMDEKQRSKEVRSKEKKKSKYYSDDEEDFETRLTDRWEKAETIEELWMRVVTEND